MHRELAFLQASYQRELDGFPAGAAQLHPGNDPAQWNVQQVVEHLLLTYRVTGGILEERLQKGRVTQSKTSARQWVARQYVLTCGLFPNGRPVPDNVRPLEERLQPRSGGELSHAMKEDLDAMDRLLDECESRFGGKKIATHQVFGPITAHQWRKFHAVHGAHHLKQLRRTKAAVAAASGHSS